MPAVWQEPDHPRVYGGHPSKTGGQFRKKFAFPPAKNLLPFHQFPDLKPSVTNVGGDIWNRQTAVRLEYEYEKVKPILENIVQKGMTAKGLPAVAPPPPSKTVTKADKWNNLSSKIQDKIETKWKEDNSSYYYDNEFESWQESEQSFDQMYQMANDFNSKDETGWFMDAVDEFKEQWLEDTGTEIPFNTLNLAAATQIEYDSGADGPTIEFDDKKLVPNIPDNFGPDQPSFAGFEAPHPANLLTPVMREQLITMLTKEFKDKASELTIDPPSYLNDSAAETLNDTWSEMDDTEKYDYALSQYDNIGLEGSGFPNPWHDDDEIVGYGNEIIGYPTAYDPIGDLDNSKDYEKTKKIAHYLANTRTAQILRERKLSTDDDETLTHLVADLDFDLWAGWKESSKGQYGRILQLAVSEELGARHHQYYNIDYEYGTIDDVKKLADENFDKIGGFEGVKAMVRAKWETTQYLLDKAGKDTVRLYRGVRLHKNHVPPEVVTVPSKADPPLWPYTTTSSANPDFKAVPHAYIKRNGAASFTTDIDIANGWAGGPDDPGHYTIRAEVPRTAIISVPVYGVNVYSEHEVVIAGTGWKHWDVWQGNAPDLKTVPWGDSHGHHH